MHLFLNKTTKAKSNTEPHRRYRVLFAITSHHTFMSSRSRSLNCFFPQYQRGDCITRGFQKLHYPKFLLLFDGQLNIFQQKLLCEIMQMPKKSHSAIRYIKIQEQLLAEGLELFSLSILSHLGSLQHNLLTFLNKEKLYTR